MIASNVANYNYSNAFQVTTKTQGMMKYNLKMN